MATITVGYWGIRGLAAPLRMMVLYQNESGALLNNISYDLLEKEGGGFDAAAWFSKKPELKAINPLMNLPFVVYHSNADGESQENDIVVSQSNACLAFLGRKLNMMGSTDAEYIRCEELLCELMDLRNKMVEFAYRGDIETYASRAQSLLDEVLSKNGIIQKLELCLERNQTLGGSSSFFVGSKASAPDFHGWELLEQYSALAQSIGAAPFLADYPLLESFRTQFAADPKNRLYFESPLYQLPFNNLMASFGSLPGGGRWTPGTVCPHQGTSTGLFGGK